MSVKELLGLENLLLSKDLSEEEYFGIVISSTELERAKTTVESVVNRLLISNDNSIDSRKLQNLYEDFFQMKIDQSQTVSNNRVGAWSKKLVSQQQTQDAIKNSSSSTKSQNVNRVAAPPAPPGFSAPPGLNRQPLVAQIHGQNISWAAKTNTSSATSKNQNVNETTFPLVPSFPTPSLNNPSGSQESTNDDNLSINQSGKNKKKKRKKKKNNSSDEPAPVILWFRRDLRLYDNPALVKAAFDDNGNERPVIPVFIWNEKEEKERMENGGAVKVWLNRALEELNNSLDKHYGSRLILRHCEASTIDTVVYDLLRETGARTVVWTALYEPWIMKRDQMLKSKLESRGIKVHVEHSYLLHLPNEVNLSDSHRGLGSVRHFMDCCTKSMGSRTPIGVPIEPPKSLKCPPSWPFSNSLEQLKLYVKPVRKDGTKVDWAKQINASWQFGEDGAYDQLCRFLEEDVIHYEKESSRADMPWTSVTSPYIHWGQLSPRTVLHEALSRGRDATKFRRKLAWRDMSYWILCLFPNMDTTSIRPMYERQWWSQDKDHLKAWQKGNTGFPLVDAAMRQLWAIGWMNNYMRHVVASFLISYLRISWVEGYKWFQDTLLDADVAINAMMWQNGGMSGLDQWNFVMHPIDAAQTCDPKGDFVRKWIPELSKLPEQFVHCPWKCPTSILSKCGLVIGKNYPERIIKDLDMARNGSLQDVATLRQQSPNHIDPHSGRDIIRMSAPTKSKTIAVPLITRREFMYKTLYPSSNDNPYNAVLKGYVSRKRDEEVARMQQVDFASGTVMEEMMRYKKEHGIVDEKPKRFSGGKNRFKSKLDGRA